MIDRNIHKLLLIPNFGLGDTFMALPLLKKIKIIFPHVHSTVVVVGKRNYSIFKACDCVNDYLYIEDPNIILEEHSLSIKWAKVLEIKVSENDLIICLVNNPFFKNVLRNIQSNKLLFWRDDYLGTKERIYEGFHRMINDYFGWEKEWILNTIPKPKTKHIDFLHYWIDKNKLENRNTACLILKARTSDEVSLKDIPHPIAELITDFFVSKSYKPCIIIPPDLDEELYTPLLRRKDILVISLSDIQQILVLIKWMDMVIGPDTGFMHFAGLADKKVISLFSHSSKIFYPTGRNVVVIDKGIGCEARCSDSKLCSRFSSNCLSTLTLNDLEKAFYQVKTENKDELLNEHIEKNSILKNEIHQFNGYIFYKY